MIPKIAVCIPTFNRAKHLENCLRSVEVAARSCSHRIEVCVSDNGSSDDTWNIINKFTTKLPLKLNRNTENLGIPLNFLKVVSMASAEFVWLLGDDDLLLPDTFDRLLPLLDLKSEVDFFYLNSFHLDLEYIEKEAHPFSIFDLPDTMEKFSSFKFPGELPFFKLIEPKISFDFLGGMFLSVFRKSKWDLMVDKLDQDAIRSRALFSHFDNTFPHLKIWAHAFSKSTAYVNVEPMSVCVTGAREWAPLEPVVRNIRLVEALDIYRQNGMSYWRYVRCKNFALRNYVSCTINMILNRGVYTFKLNLFNHFMKCWLYPNVYLSSVYLLTRKLVELGTWIINGIGKKIS